ncbi:hypothetical protein MTO96_032083, partial [Rhipicephalus appendiculatus]
VPERGGKSGVTARKTTDWISEAPRHRYM